MFIARAPCAVHPVFYNRYNAESSTPGKSKAALEATSHVTSQEDLLKQMDAAKEARALPSWAAPVASLVHAAAPLPLPVGDNLQVGRSGISRTDELWGRLGGEIRGDW